MDDVLNFIDSEFTGFSSTTHDLIRGMVAFRRTMEYYLNESEDVQFHVYDVSIQEVSPLVIATFYWVVTIQYRKHSQDIYGRGSHIWQQRNGEWKIIHEHFSRAQHK